MNKRKLLNLAAKIEKVNPISFNMAVYNDANFNRRVCLTDVEEHPSAFCIAGWQQVFKGHCLIGTRVTNKLGKYLGQVDRMAAEDLELTPDERKLLFFMDGWPLENYREMFPNTAKGAADRIRYMVRTGQ